jgi:hypothetical protein
VCFIVHKTILELKRVILTTLYFARAENIDTSLATFYVFYKGANHQIRTGGQVQKTLPLEGGYKC